MFSFTSTENIAPQRSQSLRGHAVLPELALRCCVPQASAVDVPVAPWVREFHCLNGLPVNPQWFQVFHLQQHFWGRRTGLLGQQQAPAMPRTLAACEVPSVCRALASSPQPSLANPTFTGPCPAVRCLLEGPVLLSAPPAHSHMFSPSTSTSRFRGSKLIVTSNNIDTLVGWATVQDALSPLGLFFFRGWYVVLLDGLLIQLMEPVDNVSSNNRFPRA